MPRSRELFFLGVLEDPNVFFFGLGLPEHLQIFVGHVRKGSAVFFFFGQHGESLEVEGRKPTPSFSVWFQFGRMSPSGFRCRLFGLAPFSLSTSKRICHPSPCYPNQKIDAGSLEKWCQALKELDASTQAQLRDALFVERLGPIVIGI